MAETFSKTFSKHNMGKNVIITFVGFFALLLGVFVNEKYHFYLGVGQLILAFVLYAATVYLVAERNWLDVRAVFTGVWIATIGLAIMRFNEYQKPWIVKTWVLLAVAYLVYQIGATIGILFGEKFLSKTKKISEKLNWKRVYFKLKEERLFMICVVTTLIGLACFLINVAIRGFIPAFSSSLTAYLDFYTKFHMFAVGSTAISGLCYYCIKTQPLGRVKKAILWACIFYLIILFPILVVSRGTFIVAGLSLTTAIFYLNKKKLLVLILCIAAMAGVYLFTSSLRGYSDEYLDQHFEPVETTVSPKMSFLYGYFTVSHDNFNEAVEHTEGYTWGARQAYPFNVILRIPKLTELRDNGEWYRVREHLPTINMQGVFYYDFHEWGVVICTLLWAAIFGIMQSLYIKSKNPFSLFVLGYGMVPIALSFFGSWIDMFEIWMYWGVILIVAIFACIRLKPKNLCVNQEE